ncbi:phosphoglucosamine mutase [Brachyspira hyodysenteriae]|uniref:phosphoglucosamine mutase n=1 Tax=Brachyspira hyodysenteriae TaxID=159 RepID=UPI002B2584B2|nr:phosphoglucosamine mutase [Brachyspira hyodysenteriae]WPC25009.1 phosphoglucosamine mutase [Brachyspira hyodysenteriae]
MPTLKTSISGIRGIIGDGLDIKAVVDYTSAFACLFPKKAKILVARDTRITGESILNAVVSTLTASGINVIDIGITPTPTALYMVEKLKIHGGIMISASHNPIEWNALKLIGKGGHFLDEKSVNEVIKLYDKKASRFVKALETGTYEKIDNAIEEHIKRILRWIDADKIKKANFKVACDYVNGTGLFATPPLLKALGVKEVSINKEHTGKFAHIAEPSAASMKNLSDLVKKNKVNIGFTQDPDADRLALVLDDGTIVSEEYTLALCAKYLWLVGKGNAAVNLSTSRMIDDLAKEKGYSVDRTKIGEINVSSHVVKNKLYFGGEGNGGIIVPAVTPGRDSLLGIALILELMAKTGKTITELVNEIPKYEIVKEKLEVSKIDEDKFLKQVKEEYPKAKITTIDGIKIDLEEGWLHVRSSNTEPIVRIISEAKSKKEAKELITSAMNMIKGVKTAVKPAKETKSKEVKPKKEVSKKTKK